jgi:hypothetical protein
VSCLFFNLLKFFFMNTRLLLELLPPLLGWSVFLGLCGSHHGCLPFGMYNTTWIWFDTAQICVYCLFWFSQSSSLFLHHLYILSSFQWRPIWLSWKHAHILLRCLSVEVKAPLEWILQFFFKCKFDTCKMAANVPSTLEWNLSLMGLVQSIFSSLFAHNLVK